MNTDTMIPELAAAFVAALGSLSDVAKGKTADAGGYRYSYADLASVLADVRPVLAAHNLAVSQDVATEPLDTGNGVAVLVTTVILHSGGGTHRSPVLRLTSPPDPQRIGSALTYARRYSLMATLGISSTDDDDDAAGARPAPSSSQQPAPPSPRSQAEAEIRRLLAEAPAELRARVQSAFKAQFGSTLSELPTDEHDAALLFTISRLDPDHPFNTDAADRAAADEAHRDD